MATLSKEFIIDRQGKKVVLYAGLLHLAHERGGLKTIRACLVQSPSEQNGMTAICQATVEIGDQTFEDIGDASPVNVARMVAPHIIRMAATRAKARALRDALDIGYVAAEELDYADEPADDQRPQPERPATAAHVAAVNAAGGRTAEKARADYGTLILAGQELGVTVPPLPANISLAEIESAGKAWAAKLRSEREKAVAMGASDAETI